ncbi:hypothetical protein C7M51_04435 (plasmid) [Mixta intestinalis]|uniref:Uncharacterized protein n=1 Tax=Mixta intestinalis TaxID=1615494 RepID=A0A6P1Q7A7_9GAMM|nr:hypothetical protein C7M51_04435 [Mixta intestinalis]
MLMMPGGFNQILSEDYVDKIISILMLFIYWLTNKFDL